MLAKQENWLENNRACAICHNTTSFFKEVRANRSPPLREGYIQSTKQDVVLFERFQAYPDKMIENCE